MDPNACLTALLVAFEACDKDQAKDRLEDLLSWMNKNGFPPSVENGFLVQQKNIRIWAIPTKQPVPDLSKF